MADFLSQGSYKKKSIFNNDSLLNTKIPFSREVEAAVISAFFFDSDVFARFRNDIQLEDFYFPYHRDIFNAIMSTYDTNNIVDFVLIQNYLADEGRFTEQLRECLFSLQEDVLSVGMIETYVPLLKEKSCLRKIISLANSILGKCYEFSYGDNVSNIIDSAEQMFINVLSQHSNSSYLPISLSVKNIFESIASSHGTGMMRGFVRSGYGALDDIIYGFHKGDLIIVAARPSMGKTAFSLCLARNMVATGLSVAYISLEMGAEQLAMRILSFDSGVALSSLKSGEISSEEWMRLTDSAARISDYSIFIDDVPGQSVLDIKGRIRKIFLEKKISVVIVDYLQLIQGSKKFESRHHEVSEISRSLKQLAKELDVPVIALSQLSRQVENRVEKRPLLSDLRDSGAIEQDADLILFLYRDEVYNKETEARGIAEVIIGKHRNGPTGTVNLRYVRELTLFEDI